MTSEEVAFSLKDEIPQAVRDTWCKTAGLSADYLFKASSYARSAGLPQCIAGHYANHARGFVKETENISKASSSEKYLVRMDDCRCTNCGWNWRQKDGFKLRVIEKGNKRYCVGVCTSCGIRCPGDLLGKIGDYGECPDDSFLTCNESVLSVSTVVSVGSTASRSTASAKSASRTASVMKRKHHTQLSQMFQDEEKEGDRSLSAFLNSFS